MPSQVWCQCNVLIIFRTIILNMIVTVHEPHLAFYELRGPHMETILEIKNRSIAINTARRHRDYCKTAMLFFVLDGNVVFSYENRDVRLNRSDLLVLNKGCEFSYQGSDDILLASLELMGQTFESACDGINRMVNCNSSMYENDHYSSIRKLLRQMLLNQTYVKEKDFNYPYLVFDYYSLYYKLLEIIVAFFLSGESSESASGSSSIKDADRKEIIERYVNIHYAESLSLEELASELFLSKGYLSRYFTQRFGIPFSRYLKELRLKRAMSDLLYTEKTVTQIALDNGFTNSSFFNRSFRDKYRQTPSEVRHIFRDEVRKSTEEKENEAVRERVSRLLDESMESLKTVGEEQLYRYSVKENKNAKICQSGIINMGSAADLMNSDMQEHLAILKDAAPFKYVRFWNPFSEELHLSINETRENYNFSRLDRVIGYILKNGMKPFISFEPKMERINEEIESVIVRKNREREIRTPESWIKITSAFAKHIVQLYGIEEVEQWIFEIPFGVYKIEGKDPEEGYLLLYSTLWEAFHQYTCSPEIGGPSLPSDEISLITRLLSKMKESGRLPDFVSAISFAYETDSDSHKYTTRSFDEQYLIHDIRKLRNAISEAGFDKLPLYLTEWNETIADRNYINDSCYRGAYILKSLLEMNTDVQMVGYFSGTDRRSEYFDSHLLLQGGNGLLSRDGIMKPAGFAMQLWNGLADHQIALEDNFIVTTNRRNSYYIAAHNKRPLSLYYYKTPENAVEKEKLLKYYEDEVILEQNLELNDVENGAYEIRTQKVNEHSGSILNLWKELGFSESLSRRDIQYVRKVCEPHYKLEYIQVTDNRIRLKLVMQPNEITLIEIRSTIG